MRYGSRVGELECDGSEVVIRFLPISLPKLLQNAEDTFDDDVDNGHPSPRYGISVLAGVCEGDETLDEAVSRIVSETHLTGRTITVTTGNRIRAIGLELVEDATELEPRHHLVGEDPFAALPRVDLLGSLLENSRRRNPAWTKGAS